MKQMWQNASTGKTSVVDVPAPRAGCGQILVRVVASLISAGTERSVVEFTGKNLLGKAMARPDLVHQVVEKAKREGWLSTIEAARNKLDSEMVLGYSNAGVVLEVGQGVTEFKVGDHVACAGGGFATHSEIVSIPRTLAAVVPAGARLLSVSFEQAAFATVGAIALQGVRLAELRLGEIVAVIGLGLIGQIAVQLARSNGCTVIGMDPSEERCHLAERLGCIATASSEEALKVIAAQCSGGHGCDAVLIAAATESNGPVSLAADIARDRATVVATGLVGVSLPRKAYFMKELDFRISRSSGPGRYDSRYENKGIDYPIGYVRWTEGRNLSAILDLLAQGKLDFAPLVTHRFPIEQADKGYEVISGRTGEPFLGVLITYPNEPSLARRISVSAMGASVDQAPQSVRLGVIGAGNFATAVLLPAIKAVGDIELRGICSMGGTTARVAANRFGFQFCASDISELIGDETINTIAICSRHATHAGQVIPALESGKHVFCEKPLAINEDQLLSVVAAYQKRRPGTLLMVGYNRRFAHMAKRLKAFVADVKEPFMMSYRVNAGYIPADHWTQDVEDGGRRIVGEVCHFVDFLSFVCGQPVTAVSATLAPNVGRYCDDNLSATLRFADGSVGTILYVANGVKSYSKERVEVFAQGRVAVLDDFRELRTIRDGNRTRVRSHLRVDKGHRGEWEEFSRQIQTGGHSPIAFDQLVNSTKATLALVHSAPNGDWINVDSERVGLSSRNLVQHQSLTSCGCTPESHENGSVPTAS